MKAEVFEISNFDDLLNYCKTEYSPYKHFICDTFEERVEIQLNDYLNTLEGFNTEDFLEIGTTKSVALKLIRSKIAMLQKLIKNFYRGEIITALSDFKRTFKINDLPIYELDCYQDNQEGRNGIYNNSLWYRMRKCDSDYLLPKEQMFHIPLNKRYLVGNQRYSVSGFPCLYLGKSLYICWEELNRPSIYTSNMSCIEVAKPIKCIDMRLPKRITNISHLIIIPLIIASSQKVLGNGDFKAEYILSQFMLQNLIDHNRANYSKEKLPYRIHGIIYTSTRIGEKFAFYEDESLYENIVIPTLAYRQSSNHKLCRQLCDEFKISDSISYNIDHIQNAQATYLYSGNEEGFSLSIFGKLQNKLNNSIRYELDPDPDKELFDTTIIDWYQKFIGDSKKYSDFREVPDIYKCLNNEIFKH